MTRPLSVGVDDPRLPLIDRPAAAARRRFVIYIAGAIPFIFAGMISPFRFLTTTLIFTLPALLLPATADEQAASRPTAHSAWHGETNENRRATSVVSADETLHTDSGNALLRNYLEPKGALSSLRSGYFESETEQ